MAREQARRAIRTGSCPELMELRCGNASTAFATQLAGTVVSAATRAAHTRILVLGPVVLEWSAYWHSIGNSGGFERE